MIEQFDADDFGGLFKPFGDADIGTAGRKGAAWVVVCDDDTGGAIGDGVGKDFARVYEALVERADMNGTRPNQSRRAVECQRKEIFLTFVSVISKQSVGVVGTAYSRCGRMFEEALTECQRRNDL